MSKKRRRRFSSEEKVGILKRHLLEQASISDLCDEYGLNPTVFYRWQREFFGGGPAAFERKREGHERQMECKIEEGMELVELPLHQKT